PPGGLSRTIEPGRGDLAWAAGPALPDAGWRGGLFPAERSAALSRKRAAASGGGCTRILLFGAYGLFEPRRNRTHRSHAARIPGKRTVGACAFWEGLRP